MFYEDGAWLGEGCVILKGVTVGERAVVGANVVVTKDVPPFTVIGGVPARSIRNINGCSLQEKSIDEYEIIGISTYIRL
ncbi:MAG: hypothetical protein KAV87_57660 [Desulfobacteraceae bacterium]|nr:hypothetical protein [Desulfobacteraceae bacterium]